MILSPCLDFLGLGIEFSDILQDVSHLLLLWAVCNIFDPHTEYSNSEGMIIVRCDILTIKN